jgi:hypothetical protein
MRYGARKAGGEILGRGGGFFEEFFLAIYHRVDVGRGQLEAMAMVNGVGRAGFDTVAAKNAARIVDVVDTGVAFAGGYAVGIGIFRGFDVNTARGARGRAQEAANAFFQSSFVTVENMDAAVSRLEMDGFFGIIFGDGFPQHVAEGHAEAFYKRDEGFASFSDEGRHRTPV